MFQKFIVLLVSFSLLFADVIPRDSRDDIMDTTRVTKIPFGFYKEKMEKGTYKVIDKEDLSAYPLKRIFAGYGVFDLKEKSCKYIENNDNRLSFKNKFEKINVFKNNTFAISRSKMTYPQCVALTNKYIGEVYAPHNIVEDNAVSRGFYLEDDAWIGLQKSSCSDDYINASGIHQGYENFLHKNEPCDETKLNVAKIAGSTSWVRRNRNEYRKCIIRIKTNNYLKPIKICAPWWRIESTFVNKNKESLIWGGKEISFDNFMMPDVPQRVNICTEKKVPQDPAAANARKRISCKKYYSRLAGGGRSGQCLEEPIQPACEINECAGYIEKNCNKIERLDSYKDYTWGYITRRGQRERVKIYDKIRTYIYDCPAVNPNSNNCLKREEVVIFPKECPSSHCAELRECIQSNSHTPGYCKSTYPCEKVYGDPDIAPVYENGHIKALKAKCSDGSIVVNDQIREQTYSKTDCVRYEEISETNTTIKKCIAVKERTVHEVNASITEPDIYADDPECVRTNNIEDSRPYVDAVFDYVNRGFFTTVIEKAYISGEHNDTTDMPAPENQLPYQISNIKSTTYNSQTRTEIDNSGIVSKEECDLYFNQDNWYENRLGALYSDPSILPVGVVAAAGPSSPYPVAAVVKSFDCDLAVSKTGYVNITDTVDYADYPFAKLGIASNEILRDANVSAGSERTCVLGDNALSGDAIVKLVNIDAQNDYVAMSTEESRVNKLQCQKFAECLGLAASDTYTDDTSLQTCQITNNIPEEPVNVNPTEGQFVDFVESQGSIATTLDGTKDMIVLQEYAPGRFGYMSNFRFKLPQNNTVKLNNKEIFPLIPNAPIMETLTYNYDVHVLKQTCKNKSPSSVTPYYETLTFGAIDPGGNASAGNNYGAALAGGVGAGLGALVVTGALAATGVGIVVAVVIALFAGNKRYGTIRSHWSITKDLDSNTSYVMNPYGYEFREYDSAHRRLTYERTKFQMAMIKRGTFENNLKSYSELKQTSLYFAGYTRAQIQSPLLTRCEKNQCIGYPGKVKWYKFSGRKSAQNSDRGNPTIQKPVNTIYMGAVNTVVVFVPYLGDYEMIALDKHKNVLGKKVITQQDFIDTDPYKHPFAKVMFTLSNEFGLAPGVDYGTTDKACLYDDFAEWGGGVSGVYYEDGTPSGHKCAKSNDTYVKESSAYYIKFKAVDADKYFEVKLKKPMPFANRFYFVNLGKLEKRRYECYKNKEPCTP